MLNYYLDEITKQEVKSNYYYAVIFYIYTMENTIHFKFILSQTFYMNIYLIIHQI